MNLNITERVFSNLFLITKGDKLTPFQYNIQQESDENKQSNQLENAFLIGNQILITNI